MCCFTVVEKLMAGCHVSIFLDRWALYPPGKVPLGVTVHVNDEDGDVNIDTPSSLQVSNSDILGPMLNLLVLVIFLGLPLLNPSLFVYSGGLIFIHFLLMKTSQLSVHNYLGRQFLFRADGGTVS